MAIPTPTAITSRRRPKPTGDEEATAQLKLGDMSNSPALSTAAAYELLITIEKSREKDSSNLPKTNDIISKTNKYLETFARFKGTETVQQVGGEADMRTELSEFERAQLGTLCCDTAEEARTLIPSLEGKLSDDELQSTLDNISKLRDFS